MLGIDMVLDKLEARMVAIRRVLYVALGVVLLLSIGAGAVAHHLRKFAADIIDKLRTERAAAERNAEAAQSATRRFRSSRSLPTRWKATVRSVWLPAWMISSRSR